MKIQLQTLVCCTSVLAISTQSYQAQAATYESVASGSWNNAANWTPGGGPPGSATIGNTDNAIIRSNHVFTIDGFNVHLNNPNVGSFVSTAGPGSLIITNGGSLLADSGPNQSITIGARTAGDVTVTGAGSLLQANKEMLIAFLDKGFVHVRNGGVVQSPLVYLGYDDTGTFNIQNGGTFRTAGGSSNLILGTASGTGVIDLQSGGTLELGGVNGMVKGTGIANFKFNGGTLRVISNDFSTSVNATLVAATTSTFDSNGKNGTWNGVLSSGGGLIKTGAGNLTLTGANIYGGGTLVSGGTLRANNLSGSATGSGSVLVGSGGALGGNGTVSGLVTVQAGGKLAPGNSPGILNLAGGLALQADSVFAPEINGTTVGTDYDQANVTGTVDLTNGILSITMGFSPTVGSQYMIINNDLTDAIGGTFQGLAEGAFLDASSFGYDAYFNISYQGLDGLTGNDVVLTATIPEPSTWMLVSAGAVLLCWRRRTR